jgi:condensin complex subunit 1
VTGNAENDIGDRIAGVRETELLYGAESLLALYGPVIVHICGSPHRFKVSHGPSTVDVAHLLQHQNRTLRAVATLSFSKLLCLSSQLRGGRRCL